MPTAYATKVAEAFSAKVMRHVYARSIFDMLVNRDYQGDISAVGSKCNILTLDKIAEKIYTGANMVVDPLYESNAVLTIDQKKAFYFSQKTLDRWASFVKDPKSVVVEQKGNERKKNVDTFVLGFYGDVAAGQRVGTDYITGTVTVDVTTGAVTGSGTTFTSAMVGRGFKATGHTSWYRVKTYTSATAIVIEDDLDDIASAYTGGAIGGGATYIVEANTPVTLTGGSTGNLLAQIALLKTKLDDAEVPDEDRCLIVPSVVENLIPQAPNIALQTQGAYDELVKRGYITTILGFNIFRSTRTAGDNTNGYHVIAAHRNWLTFADKVLEVGMEEDLIGNFGAAYKDLYVYGAKVADVRRKMAAELFCKV